MASRSRNSRPPADVVESQLDPLWRHGPDVDERARQPRDRQPVDHEPVDAVERLRSVEGDAGEGMVRRARPAQLERTFGEAIEPVKPSRGLAADHGPPLRCQHAHAQLLAP